MQSPINETIVEEDSIKTDIYHQVFKLAHEDLVDEGRARNYRDISVPGILRIVDSGRIPEEEVLKPEEAFVSRILVSALSTITNEDEGSLFPAGLREARPHYDDFLLVCTYLADNLKLERLRWRYFDKERLPADNLKRDRWRLMYVQNEGLEEAPPGTKILEIECPPPPRNFHSAWDQGLAVAPSLSLVARLEPSASEGEVNLASSFNVANFAFRLRLPLYHKARKDFTGLDDYLEEERIELVVGTNMPELAAVGYATHRGWGGFDLEGRVAQGYGRGTGAVQTFSPDKDETIKLLGFWADFIKVKKAQEDAERQASKVGSTPTKL